MENNRSDAEHGQSSAPVERSWSAGVQPLQASAVQLMAECEFKQALLEWQQALPLAADSKERAMLYAERSRCYSEFNKYLRALPAAYSERCAQYAEDPSQLARLALIDADKALAERPDWVPALSRRGQALLLLEDYQGAENCFLSVISQDGGNHEALEGLRAIKAVEGAGGAQSRSRQLRTVDDLECSICCKLFWKPVTTPCGHTFCSACFSRSLDHHSRCPMCRRVLHTGRDLPVTTVLHNLIVRNFPEEAEERRRESCSLAGAAPGAEALPQLPMFVMSPMLPFERMSLNIFEPRYRLMVRRCMEGHKMLAMTCALQGEDGQMTIPPVACECRIEECQVQPDGRYYLEIVGTRRVSVESDWELDGYRVCQPALMVDDPPAADLSGLCKEVEIKTDAALEKLRASIQQSSGARRLFLTEKLQSIGAKPSTADPEAFSFWAANIVMNQVSCSPADKLRTLMLTDTHERLQWLLTRIQGLCSIM